MYELDERFGSIGEELLFFSPEAAAITAGLFRRICDGFMAMTEEQAAEGMHGLSAMVLSRLSRPKVSEYENMGREETNRTLLSPRPLISSLDSLSPS